jgi:hypothetical protein
MNVDGGSRDFRPNVDKFHSGGQCAQPYAIT